MTIHKFCATFQLGTEPNEKVNINNNTALPNNYQTRLIRSDLSNKPVHTLSSFSPWAYRQYSPCLHFLVSMYSLHSDVLNGLYFEAAAAAAGTELGGAAAAAGAAAAFWLDAADWAGALGWRGDGFRACFTIFSASAQTASSCSTPPIFLTAASNDSWATFLNKIIFIYKGIDKSRYTHIYWDEHTAEWKSNFSERIVCI